MDILNQLLELISKHGLSLLLSAMFLLYITNLIKNILPTLSEISKRLQEVSHDLDNHSSKSMDIETELKALKVETNMTLQNLNHSLEMLVKTIEQNIAFNKDTHRDTEVVQHQTYDIKLKLRETKVLLEQLLLLQVGDSKCTDIIEYSRKEAKAKMNEDILKHKEENK